MSAPSTMSCEHANDLLTELVCGELDAASEAAVRAHAATCEKCAPELAKFTRVLGVAESMPLDVPSPAVEQRIMQAAREALSRKAGSAEAIDSSTGTLKAGGGFRAWLEKLGNWAMSPQVAMASVLLLVVGIGLYALPFGQDASAPQALQLAEEPAETAAPAATAASVPGEGEAAERAQDRAAKPAPEPAAAPQAEAKRKEASARDMAKSEKSADDSLTGRLGAVADKPAKRARAASGAGPKGGAMDDAWLGGDLDDSASAGGKAASAGNAYAPPPPVDMPAAKKPSAPAPAPQPTRPSAFAEAEAPAAEAVAASAPSKDSLPVEEGAAPNFGQMLDQGLSAARSGQHARAVELLEPVVDKGPDKLRASARPALASSLRALGQCTRALPYYSQLVKAKSVSSATLLEAADCYERAGNAAMARDLRSRADMPAGVAPATRE